MAAHVENMVMDERSSNADGPVLIIEKPRSTGETAKKFAYRIIRENIINMNLRPGEMISDSEIAIKLGISRTPVREAIIQLNNESGIIEIFPQRGMRVAYIDLKKVCETRFIRITLEKEMVRNACDLATAEDIKALKENINLQEFYLSQENYRKVLEYDDKLHRKLFQICGCDMTYNLISECLIHYDRVRNLETKIPGYDKTSKDHREIIEAIEQKDKTRAEQLIVKHLGRWKMNEQQLHEEYAEFFVDQDEYIPAFLQQ